MEIKRFPFNSRQFQVNALCALKLRNQLIHWRGKFIATIAYSWHFLCSPFLDASSFPIKIICWFLEWTQFQPCFYLCEFVFSLTKRFFYIFFHQKSDTEKYFCHEQRTETKEHKNSFEVSRLTVRGALTRKRVYAWVVIKNIVIVLFFPPDVTFLLAFEESFRFSCGTFSVEINFWSWKQN